MFGAAFMGVGAMVGAGIFALLGQAGAIAGTAVWISFLIAGAISNAPGLLLREARRSLPLQRWNDRVSGRGVRQRASDRERAKV